MFLGRLIRAACVLGFVVTDMPCIPSALENFGCFDAGEDKQNEARRSIDLIGV